MPLVVTNKFYFPFTFSKATLFRLTVELMLLIYLLLAYSSRQYRLRITPLTWLYAIWIGFTFISSLLGANFYLSFWGDFERSEGILLHLHLLVFLIILTSAVKEGRHWKMLLNFLFGAGILSAFIAMGQYFNLSFILNTQGERLSGAIGNPGFFAAYLIFNIFFALYLASQTGNRYLKIIYVLTSLVFVFLVYATATRGAMVALILTFILSGLFVGFSRGRSRRFKIGFSVLLLLFIVTSIFIRTQKDSDWITAYGPLHRIARLSFQERTVQTRLMAWEISVKGWKEHPVLGNGLENFNIVFNKYFNPLFYQDEGSVVWFDRAHNVVFERLVTGGLVGFISYFAIIGYALYFLTFKVWRESRDRDAGLLLALLVVAHLVQNLFIFDSVVTNVLFIFTLGFISQYEKDDVRFVKLFPSKTLYVGLLAAYIILILPILNFIVIKPAKASNLAAQSFSAQAQLNYSDNTTFHLAEIAFDKLEQAIRLGTYGNQELRVQLAQYVDTLIANNYSDRGLIGEAVIKVNENIARQLQEEPQNVANYLLAMRHYNFAREINPGYLNQSLSIFKQAIPLSPARVHLYQEAGYSEVFLAQIAEDGGDPEAAAEHYKQALIYFQQTIDLNPAVIESYINKVMAYLSSGQLEQVDSVLEEMDSQGINYHDRIYLRKMASLAVKYGHYNYANQFLQELFALDENNKKNAIDLALSYACIGEDEKAIELAQSIAEQFPENQTDADNFIQSVQGGIFRDGGKACQQ